MYGYYPSIEINQQYIKLRPILKWKTKIIQLKRLSKGAKISYGGIYQTINDTLIATIPVGYADGFRRLLTYSGINLSKPWHVLIRGQYAPIIGRICMDMCMVDVTHIKDVQENDEVILLDNSIITCDKMADQLQTISYEIISGIGKRVPRVYLQNNKIKNIVSLHK